MRLELVVPIRTAPGQNAREHWRARAARVKRERGAAYLALKSTARHLKGATYPLMVTLTRFKPRGPPLDSDNLSGSMKACRDGVADGLGIDDGDESAALWKCEQAKGPWGVKVLIEDQFEIVDVEPTTLTADRGADGAG